VLFNELSVDQVLLCDDIEETIDPDNICSRPGPEPEIGQLRQMRFSWIGNNEFCSSGSGPEDVRGHQ